MSKTVYGHRRPDQPVYLRNLTGTKSIRHVDSSLSQFVLILVSLYQVTFPVNSIFSTVNSSSFGELLLILVNSFSLQSILTLNSTNFEGNQEGKNKKENFQIKQKRNIPGDMHGPMPGRKCLRDI